MDTDIEELT